MKSLLMLLSCGLLVGCDYTVPLVQTPETDIDNAVLGLWQRTKENGKIEQLLVLPIEKREYLVSYPAESDNAMFARACLAQAGGKTVVQLKWFGTAEGNVPDDNRVFQYVTYSVSDDKLTFRLLNSEVVKKDVNSTDALAKAIAANTDKPQLFKEAVVFSKVAK